MIRALLFKDDQQLIEGCLRGDQKAQKHLYDQYSGKLFALCLRYMKDHDLAQDVLIEGFMRIFEKLEQFKHEGSFEGWMKRLMVNHALMTLRKNRATLMELNWDDERSELKEEVLQSDHLEAEDMLSMVKALPVGYRTVFNLYAIEGYSHKEIGDMLQISENTSKSQLSRARVLLQKMMHTSENINNAENGK
ncbi:RNA polymerase sigma factor [Penaeicola halotolerans]|uniref:RNA polymerase sigma factor n=1 Tax=Penaeicola halotolerans TaxID=2793196 RepID=UPI001CF803E9|nr:RNA polymerase sigma factor [Penaeicola halotolerans]